MPLKNGTLNDNIQNLQSRIEELEEKLSNATTQPHDGKGLSGLVCKMRREGKSDEEWSSPHFDRTPL